MASDQYLALSNKWDHLTPALLRWTQDGAPNSRLRTDPSSPPTAALGVRSGPGTGDRN